MSSMAPAAPRVLERFLPRFAKDARLGAECREALAAALGGTRAFDRGQCFVREGEAITGLSILNQGLALSTRRLADGVQQHVAVVEPGQILDQQGFIFEQAGVSCCALIPCTVVSIPRTALAQAIGAFPELAGALARELASTARVAQEWMVGMGRKSAYARVAHFLCELRTRLQAAELAGPAGCPFPLTQSDLADTVGLSVVHVNRVLQQLRQEGLIELSQSRLDVRDWPALVRAGGFDPAYLHLGSM